MNDVEPDHEAGRRLSILTRCARKYRQERDKRLRADGENQYVQMSCPLAQFLERDPARGARLRP